MQTLIAAVTREDRLGNAQYHMTLAEIGQEFGITRERVRQIEKMALDKLRTHCMPQLLQMRAMANELRKRDGVDCYGVIR